MQLVSQRHNKIARQVARNNSAFSHTTDSHVKPTLIDCKQSLFFAKVREANARFTSGARRELRGRERKRKNRLFTASLFSQIVVAASELELALGDP